MHATDPTNARRTLLFNIHTVLGSTVIAAVWHTGGHVARSPPLLRDSDIPVVVAVPIFPLRVWPVINKPRYLVSWVLSRDCQEHLWHRLFLTDEYWHHSIHSRHGLLTTLAIGPQGSIHYALEGANYGRSHHSMAAG